MKKLLILSLLLPLVISCGKTDNSGSEANFSYQGVTDYVMDGETHFTGMMKITAGGQNAEAYWNWDDTKLIFQATREGIECDQIFTMNPAGSEKTMVSTGNGRTTCAYFFPNKDRILYSSTHLGGEECPPEPDMSRGYIWGVYKSYDIFTANPDGSDLRQLTTAPGYDAEATVSKDGKIVFTSDRDGDLELYTMNSDGSNITRITHERGYDGGAFFSPDGQKIIYRGYHPKDENILNDYQTLLNDGWVRPTIMEIMICDADGSNKRQLTDNGHANFAPYFHPGGEKILFASNMDDPQGRNFEIYMMNIDGTGVERITYNESFDGFPMFSRDGKYLAFSSNRFNDKPGETNVFIAKWQK